MKHLPQLLAVWFVLSFAARVEADILTFNEVTAPANPILTAVACGETSGFRFSSDHFHAIDGDVLTDFSSNGTTHLGYESGRGFPIIMARIGSGTFSLVSLDAGEFFAPASATRPDAETLTITGYLQGGGTVTYTVSLDGVRDGPGGVSDFEHIVLPSTFVNLTSVVFTGLRAGNLAGGIAIDNIEYDAGAPEVLPACVVTPLVPPTPTISITNPVPGFVAGTLMVQATPGTNVILTSVQFAVDGVALGSPITSAPYQIMWDTTLVPDGAHTITAEGRDASNNLATTSVMVTVQNNPVTPITAYYLDFDGVNDVGVVADGNGLSFGSGTVDTPLTMELWIRPDNMTNRSQLLGKWGESTNQEYRLYIFSNMIRLDLRDQSAGATVWAFTATSLAGLVGGWHHVAVTYDGRGGATAADGITFYIDGVAVPAARGNHAAYVAMENLAGPLQIGREGPGWGQYDGGLDELRLWHVARTASELQATLTTELTGSEPGLRGYWRFNEGSGTTVAGDGPADQPMTLTNGPLWVAGGPLAPDVTAPAISNLSTSSVTATSVTVTFQTSEAATTWVSYSATGACPCVDVYSATTTGTTHVVSLTGLTPDTLYSFVGQAQDAAGNQQTSAPQSVRTLVPAADGVPPTVSIGQPGAGTVAGLVAVAATAVDAGGVVGVQVLVDGVTLGAAQTAPPYGATWDTSTVADGAHTITVEAWDAAGNRGSAAVTVTVQNTPAVLTPYYLDFDGVNDAGVVADGDGLSFGSGTVDTPLTMELWIRPDNMTNRSQLLGKWGESTNQEYRLYIFSNMIRLDLRDQSAGATVWAYTATSQAGLVGGWHHVAVTYDGRGGATAADGITFYIDGVSVPLARGNHAAYVAMENLSGPLQIGRESAGWSQYDGGLDELRLWHVARTASELQATLTTELTGSEPGLRGYWRFNEGSGTTVAGDGPADQPMTLTNGPLWVAGGPLAPDVTAPAISNLSTSSVTATSVTVTFQTSEAATTWVSYSATGACPCVDVYSATTTGTTHVVSLTGLTPDTLYSFVGQAQDAAGNQQTSAPQSVRTLVPAADGVPPTVSIGQPGAGTVAGLVAVAATAVDAGGVVGVQVLVDGVTLGATQTAPPYGATWDTSTVADGPHTITVEAWDAAGNRGSAAVTVTVQNTPAVLTPHYLDFDGVNDVGVVADGNGLSFGSGTVDTPLTMELWIRPDNMTNRSQLLGKWGESTNQEYRLYIFSNMIRLDLRDQSAGATVWAFTATSLAGLVGGWHHVAVTYDGRGGATAADGITFYIDGVAVPAARGNHAAYVAMENLAGPLQIGREGPGWGQYDGGLDELRLWHVARTASELQATLTTELTGSEPGLRGYWRFNEGSGTTVAGDGPADQPMTLTNGPLWVAGGPLAHH